MSSLVFAFASIGNGGVSDSERMRIAFALTSKFPVVRFSLDAPLLFSSTPVTAIQNSARNFPAFAKASLPQSSSSKTICKSPERSRRSTKIRLPLFLLFCTQPITVTSSPILALTTSAHLWLLFKPNIDSAIIFSPTSLILLYKIL